MRGAGPLFITIVAAAAALGGACRDEAAEAPEPARAEAEAPPPPIRVSADRDDLLFSYRPSHGGPFETADRVEDVPEEARGAVVVTDLSLTPEERRAGRYVYIADLTAEQEDGTFPVAVASRYGFEAEITGAAGAAEAGEGVVVYSASWCGVCKKTKRLLKAWGVPFEEKDIEASRSAAQELAAKAKQAGIRPGGVPVIDVGGTLLQGLDEPTLRAVLRDKDLL